MKIEQEELDEIIANHGRWLQYDGRKRAYLSGANLTELMLYNLL